MTSSVEYTINLKSADNGNVGDHATAAGTNASAYSNASISSVFNAIAALGTGYGAKIELVDFVQLGESGVAFTNTVQFYDLWLSINGIYSTFASSANSNDIWLATLHFDYSQRGDTYKEWIVAGSNTIYIYSVSSVAGITVTFKNGLSKATLTTTDTTGDYSLTLKVTPFKFS